MNFGSVCNATVSGITIAFQQLNNLRAVDNLARVANIIDAGLSNLSLAVGYPILPNLHNHMNNFAKVTYAMDAFRLAYMWLRPINSETLINKSKIIKGVAAAIDQLKDSGVQVPNSSSISKDALKEVLANGKGYRTINQFKTELKNVLIKKLERIEGNREKTNDIAKLNLDRLKLNSPSILERLSWVGYTVASVGTVIAVGQEWQLYHLGNIASKIGINKAFVSPLVLGGTICAALLIAHLCKFADLQRKLVKIKNKHERMRACWDTFLSVANIFLYTACLLGFNNRINNNITIIVKTIDLIGGAGRSKFAPVPF